MAEVYLARDTVSDNRVALKLLKEQYADSEEFRKRFRREAESITSLSHPNIVSAYDWGKAEDGRPYIAMEYVEGGTLAKRIVTKGALDPFEAAAIARQVALALEESHRHGVIHRDIKPHNIFLTGNPLDSIGAVKVGDFGIARALEATVVTGTSMILGTVGYLSPEQARGEPMGPWSDLYSLGVVLYEMLTGRVPFEADGPIAVAMKHVSEVPLSPREVNPRVPEELEAITLALLSKNPTLRYPCASTLAEDLARAGCGFSPRYLGKEESTETLEPQTLPAPRAAGRANSPGPAKARDRRAYELTGGSKRRRRRRRLSAAAIIGITVLTLAAGGPAAGLYEIPGLPALISLTEGVAYQPKGDQALAVLQTEDQPEGDQALAAQTDEGQYAAQEESEKEQTPSEPQGEAENPEEPALDSGNSTPDLAGGEPAPETQYPNNPPDSPLSSSHQPEAKSSHGNSTSTSPTSSTRTGATKGGSPPAKSIAEQTQPKSPRQDSSESISGTSAQFGKGSVANPEVAQVQQEVARGQAEDQSVEASEVKKDARVEAKGRPNNEGGSNRPDR
jgi:tRNA A-37 threonylcarbamoyl transferase component Bud32